MLSRKNAATTASCRVKPLIALGIMNERAGLATRKTGTACNCVAMVIPWSLWPWVSINQEESKRFSACSMLLRFSSDAFPQTRNSSSLMFSSDASYQ